jgi:hypothetical protein
LKLRVHAESGSAWDTSKEIAEAVLELLLDRDSRIPDFCSAFLEKTLGINYVIIPTCPEGALLGSIPVYDLIGARERGSGSSPNALAVFRLIASRASCRSTRKPDRIAGVDRSRNR